jgi:hypothetical protein
MLDAQRWVTPFTFSPENETASAHDQELRTLESTNQ